MLPTTGSCEEEEKGEHFVHYLSGYKTVASSSEDNWITPPAPPTDQGGAPAPGPPSRPTDRGVASVQGYQNFRFPVVKTVLFRKIIVLNAFIELNLYICRLLVATGH